MRWGVKEMNRIKIYLQIIILFGIIFVINSNTAHAGSDIVIKVDKSVSAKLTDCKKVKVKVFYKGNNVTDEARLSFSNSNKSIVKICKMDEEDLKYYEKGFEAWPRKVGKSVVTITAKYRPSHWDEEELDDVYDGETITATTKCVVKSEYFQSIRAYANLTDYNTRSNTFTVKVKNISNKKIKIISKGAMAYDADYTSYDRNLRIVGGRSSVTIDPGKTKNIKFKVLGNTTWYKLSDFQICSYWEWGNKKYWVSVDSGLETWMKSGKKWKWIGFAK